MVYTDSHAHIYLKDFRDDLDQVISRSHDAMVEKIFMPNIDSTSIDDMLELEMKYPSLVLPMIGLHPCSVKRDFEKELYLVEDWIKQRDFAAIGEMGTDLYWDQTFWPEQKEAFLVQCRWAVGKDWPIVIHCRDSLRETIELVKEFKQKEDATLRGIFHCFTGDLAQAQAIVDLGFSLGIGGVSTFKNGGLESVLEEIDLNHLVLETDSPYLSPHPFRGKRNEPSRIPVIAEKLASIKGVGLDAVALATTTNCQKIFVPRP